MEKTEMIFPYKITFSGIRTKKPLVVDVSPSCVKEGVGAMYRYSSISSKLANPLISTKEGSFIIFQMILPYHRTRN